MSALRALIAHSLRRTRTLLLVGSGILFLLQNMMVLVSRSFDRAGAFSQMASMIPDFIRPMLDPMFLSVLSFEGMVLVGYSHVIVIFFLVTLAILAGTEPLGEIDVKFVDLMMSRPLSRRTVIGRSVAMVILVGTVPVTVLLIGTWFGLAVWVGGSAGWPDSRIVLMLALNLLLEALAWGGIALAVAAFSKRRATAVATTGLLAFSTFLLDYVGRVWDPLDGVARISPFRYFNPFPLIAGQPVPGLHLIVLFAVFAAGALLSFGGYSRRDL